MTTPPHSRLLNAAANATLKPLGCVQKGRSRTWLDDQSFWVGVVEFQPSGWGKGSYLNVGACWLWHEKDSLSFDAGVCRVENFHSYESDEQFAPAAQALAERASEEVKKLRDRFTSPSHVRTELLQRQPRTIRDHYHLAISSGLAGDIDQSKRSFGAVISDPEARSWAVDIKRRAAELTLSLERDGEFEERVKDTIRRTRALLKLPADSAVVWDSPH